MFAPDYTNRPDPHPDEHRYLAFGVPSLDRLIGVEDGHAPADRPFLGYRLARAGGRRGESATVCLIGPDGTGKSNFALHLASDYWRRTRGAAARAKAAPRIIYASTDLSIERAQRVWRAFWLDRPFSRYSRLPFEPRWQRAGEEPADFVGPPDPAKWYRAADPLWPWETVEREQRLALTQYLPTDTADEDTPPRAGEPHPIAGYLTGPADRPEIAFLDLESTTAGDDWSFLHTLLAGLEEPADQDTPRHLLIIDAVEGLETLVGERDAFGQEQSRRARIAQVVRAAAGKCHLVFVLEEPADGERLPEVFVADLVVRLRSITDRDYARRTVELEKVRGQRHIRGQHDFGIRQAPSTTGDQANPDDPPAGLTGDPMAYIQVFPSLHYWARDARPAAPADGPADGPADHSRHWRYACFGIYQLDAMLWRAEESDYKPDDRVGGGQSAAPASGPAPAATPVDALPQLLLGPVRPPHDRSLGDQPWLGVLDRLTSADLQPLFDVPAGFDRMGVPAGGLTTLIGDDATYKSQLARSFLSQCFRVRHVFGGTAVHLPVIIQNHGDPLCGQGVGILLATYETDRRRLAQKLRHHLIENRSDHDPERDIQELGLAHRLIVRSLRPHHLSSSQLVHVVRELVEEAKRRLYDDPNRRGLERHRRTTGRIRLVIDDWATLLAVYPEVHRDPLVLPFLAAYLKGEGVTTLVLATRPGSPHDPQAEAAEQGIRELRGVADHHLDTWRVSFFDEQRVAITAQPSPVAGSGVHIRELRPGRRAEIPRDRLAPPMSGGHQTEKARNQVQEQIDREALVVDPHFELYAGLPANRPVPIPLQVHLYVERDDLPAFRRYVDEVRDLFLHLFNHDPERSVIQVHYGTSYDILRGISYLQSEARLDHTLVLQVDEFWAESRSELLRQERYLGARTVDRNDTPRGMQPDNTPANPPIKTEDPFGLFYLSDALGQKWRYPSLGPRTRAEFFDLVGYDLQKAAQSYPIDKVPFTWDFAFLVCDRVLWNNPDVKGDYRTVRFDATGNRIKQDPLHILDRMWKIEPTGLLKIQFLGTPAAGKSGPATTPPAAPEKTPVESSSRRETGAVPEVSPPVATVASNREAPTGGSAKDSQFDDHWQKIDISLPRAHWRKRRDDVLLPAYDAKLGDPKGPRAEDGGGASEDQTQQDPVSWREFLGACKVIARESRHQVLPFDVDMTTGESFSCLVLEVWFSEVYAAAERVKDSTWGRLFWSSKWAPQDRREGRRMVGLRKLLDGGYLFGEFYRRALYRAVLLLDEVLGPTDLYDDNLVMGSRPSRPNAVAARHWYSTATAGIEAAGAEARSRVVMGLPGAVAGRGDWFLAVARGSRSPRLGERAMDLLCSRRANITRLQSGLGLPVRDLFGADAAATNEERRTEYWTSLVYTDENRQRHPIPYKELRKLGAWDKNDRLGRGGFHWLWRSIIDQYDVHSRMFQRWLTLLFRQWRTWEKPKRPPRLKPVECPRDDWWDGFNEHIEYEWLDRWEATLSDEELVKDKKEELKQQGNQSRLAESAAQYTVEENGRTRSPSEEEVVRTPCYVEPGVFRWHQFSRACDGFVEGLKRAGNPANRRSE